MRTNIQKSNLAPSQRQSPPKSAPNSYRPDPEPFTDEYGRECLRVPLDRQGSRFALVGKADYQQVREAGATGTWYVNGNGLGREYVRTWVRTGPGEGTLVQVARLIEGAGRKTVIRYASGDTLDLRRDNLRWFKGRAKRNDVLLTLAGKDMSQQDSVSV